jgi:hypothetical protein
MEQLYSAFCVQYDYIIPWHLNSNGLISNRFSYYAQLRTQTKHFTHIPNPLHHKLDPNFEEWLQNYFPRTSLAKGSIHVLRVLWLLSTANKDNAERCIFCSIYETNIRFPIKPSIGGLHRKVADTFNFLVRVSQIWPPLWSNGQSSWLQILRSQVRFPALPDFLRSSGSGTGYTQPREYNWGATWMEK